MTRHKIMLCIALGLFSSLNVQANDYVGLTRCKMCHKKKEMGNQFGVWSETKHAKAYEVLGTEEAKTAGKTLGVDDPQNDGRCLICHTTGYTASAEAKAKIEVANGVTCEACHGAGSEYKSKDVHSGNYEAGVAAGMNRFKTDEEKMAICSQCHVAERDGNKNPNFKEFNLAEFLKKIHHPLTKSE